MGCDSSRHLRTRRAEVYTSVQCSAMYGDVGSMAVFSAMGLIQECHQYKQDSNSMGYSSLMTVKLLYKEGRLSDTEAEVNEVIDNTARSL